MEGATPSLPARNALRRSVRGDDMGEKRVVTITETVHLGMSKNGNSYFRLVLDDGTLLRTKMDSYVNYDVQNSENIGRPVIVELTKGGRVESVVSTVQVRYVVTMLGNEPLVG